jgi:hypothetical protein
MATLNNPVNAQNIIDRFADYVVATANSGISWGTNSQPSWFHPYFGTQFIIPSFYYGGTTGGKTIGITAPNSVYNGTIINALSIYSFLLTETNAYTRIRLVRARLIVTGQGRTDNPSGETWPVGVVFDLTAVTHLNSTFERPDNNVNNAGVAIGQVIRRATLEQFFDNLRAMYLRQRNITEAVDTYICHASCHSSCHSSRGRR